jgi:hypothetical protein
MSEKGRLPLRIVDAFELDEEVRRVLRPDELMPDAEGRMRRLPRFFYQVPSWQLATELYVVPHFSLAELIRVDVREHPAQRDFPRYVPLAITVLAVHLEVFRQSVDAQVFVAANGGYRSPSHALTQHASPHCWGTAANIFRIGDTLLDGKEQIERFNALAVEHLPGVWTRPWGRGKGLADDHVHLDLGFVTRVPRGVAGADEHPEPGSKDAERDRSDEESDEESPASE